MTNTKKRSAFLVTVFAVFMFASLALLGLTNFASAAGETPNVIVGNAGSSGDFTTYDRMDTILSVNENSPTKGTFGGKIDDKADDPLPFRRPGLMYGNEEGNSKISLYIGVSDVDDNVNYQPVVENLSNEYRRFMNYFNTSMPSGKYRMVVSAPSVTVSDTVYAAVEQTFYFEIEKATMTVSGAPTASTAWCQEGAFSNAFNDFESQMTADKFNLTVTPSGFWANESNASYYDSTIETGENTYYSGVQYQYKAGSIGEFSTPGDIEVTAAWKEVLSPILGKGTTIAVNYKVLLKNYVYESTSTFALTLNEEVAAPSGQTLSYTGSAVMPAIASSKYTISPVAGDEYIAPGTHRLTLTLSGWTSSNTRIRWAETDGTSATTTITFTIAKAQNSWQTLPNVVGWTWRTYSDSSAFTRGIPNGGSADDVVYAVYNQNNTAVTGLDAFKINARGEFLTLKEGTYQIDTTIDSTLLNLDAGEYTLRATLADDANANYSGLTSNRRFNVTQATNYWTLAPNAISWVSGERGLSDGDYTTLINGRSRYGATTIWVHHASIAANARTANNALLIITVAESPNGQSGTKTHVVNKVNIANLLGITNNQEIENLGMKDLTGGTYVMTARVANTTNYTRLDQTIEFRVIASAGTENHWTVVPNIQGWVVGNAADIPVGIPAHGKVKFAYRKVADAPGTETETVPTAIGNYILVASTYDTGSFANLTAEVEFAIIGKPFSWDVAPSIQGWHKGDAPNAPIGRVAGATVVFTYKADGNNMLTGSAEVPTEIGDYILIATATKDGQTLRAEIPFSITANPAGSVGGLTAGCIILGVLLAACIGVAIFLFVKMRQAHTVIFKRRESGSNLHELKRNAPKTQNTGVADKDAIREKLRNRHKDD